ncbi:YcaO-like family protein [Kitasatospora sp. NPDC058170]|uniref:YcaO-like family protein n=1 Tax=Kitasatospora sp. NPDC058170 TaxID=3346364 RepID=UPI0036DEECF8
MTARTDAPGTTGTSADGPRIGPGAPAGWDWSRWAAALGDCLLTAHGDLDLDWEREAMSAARATGRDLLSVRIGAGEVQLGPRWTPDGRHACAGCAGAADAQRRWPAADRPERDRRERELLTAAAAAAPATAAPATAAPPVPAPAVAPGLAEIVGAVLAPGAAPGPGELVTVSYRGTVTRHRVIRTFRCRLCGTAPALLATAAEGPPPLPTATARPTTAAVPTRQDTAPFEQDPDRMRAAFADPRFGPVVRITRNSSGGLPMTEVGVLAGTPAGLGRGVRFRESEAIGIYEAMERLAGYPHAATVVPDATRRELGDLALEPAGLGGYTAAQLAHPSSHVEPYTEDTPLDWVWAAPPLGDGAPRLVPAEIGFYRYGYGIRPGQSGARRRGCFLDSSSGSALGAGFEEAALHSLLELAERDAFLQAWHLARPLPALDPATVRDRRSRLLLRLARRHGYEVHLLDARADIPVPVVWALAVRRDRGLPASFSTAGCHPDPELAVRAALWELAQLVTAGLAWDPAPLEPLIDDPWQVVELAHHWRRYTFPELLPRVERVLGGPVLAVAEAFGDWPQPLVRAAAGDVRGALAHVVELYREAGLGTVLAVDQSTPDHTALGLSVVKCVVPGILPMCFGQAHQRLTGLDRLLARLDATPTEPPFDPHPFP